MDATIPMNDPESTAETKTRKRQAGKTPGRTDARKGKRVDVPKTTVNLRLSVDAATKLAIHAVKLGVDRCVLVEEWIHLHCRRFQVRDLERNDASDNGEDRQVDAA
jgi:hypothetical protein